jgi:hypothetical protein
VGRAVSWTLATVASRGKRFRPGSVAWCVKLLRSLPPPVGVPQDLGCAEWVSVLKALRERLRSDLVENWVGKLRGRFEDGALVLETPDPFLADFVRDQFLDEIARAARDVLGGALEVRVQAVAPAMTGTGGVG